MTSPPSTAEKLSQKEERKEKELIHQQCEYQVFQALEMTTQTRVGLGCRSALGWA